MTTDRNCPTCGAVLPEDAPAGACPRCLLADGLSDGGPDAADLAEHFPGLEIAGIVGRGGMGIVYRARQKTLDREVALKILPPEIADSPGFSDRFLREARAMAKLDHPNIVRIHDFGETDGLLWLLMELVDGVNLRQLMHEGVEPKQALAIVPPVCDALQYAHDQGVVHRDIKPENILVTRDGRVKITDFGLAKLTERGPEGLSLTATGQVMGTFQYMAPEQIRTPGDVDHRADIYSLGVVFYEMLTGEVPMGRFEPPSERVQVDVRFDHVVLRSLEREPERRYQHASEVRSEMDVISSTDAPAPAHAPARPRIATPEGPARLSKMAVFGSLAVPGVVLLAIVGVVLLALLAPDGGGTGWSIVGTGMAALGLGAVVGFVLSIVALVRISASNGRLKGNGFALVGIILPAGLFFLSLLVFPFLLMGGVDEPRPDDGPWMPEMGGAHAPPKPQPMPGPLLEVEQQGVMEAVLALTSGDFPDPRDYELLQRILMADTPTEYTVERVPGGIEVTLQSEGLATTIRLAGSAGNWRLATGR